MNGQTQKVVLLFAVVSAVWVCLLYSALFHSRFVYDDLTLVAQNPKLSHLATTLEYFWTATPFGGDFRESGATYYRPATWLSFALDRWLFGTEPTGYHMTSLLLHWFCGLLAFTLLLRLRCDWRVAACAVLLWLGLPINTEAVAWISARSYSLMFCCLLIALHALQSYLTSESWRHLLLFYAASLAGVFAHETGILVLPLAYVALAWQRARQRIWIWVLASGLCANGLYYLSRSLAGGSAPAIRLFPPEGSVYFVKYLSWMLFPVRMSMERSTDAPPAQISTSAVGFGLVVLCLFGVIVLLRSRAPRIALALSWMCAAMLPLCGFVFIYQGMAERYMYVAALGLCFALAAAVLQVPMRVRPLCASVILCWGLWGAWRTYARAADWTNERALFASSLEATPNSWVLWLNLGNTYLSERNLAKAIQDYRAALRINPRAVKAFDNLATALWMTGNSKGAEQAYRQAIAAGPDRSDGYSDLAVVLFDQGRDAEAEELLLKAIRVDSSNATAYFDLGVLYAHTGRTKEAASMYRLALTLSPNYPDAERALQLLAAPPNR